MDTLFIYSLKLKLLLLECEKPRIMLKECLWLLFKFSLSLSYPICADLYDRIQTPVAKVAAPQPSQLTLQLGVTISPFAR